MALQYSFNIFLLLRTKQKVKCIPRFCFWSTHYEGKEDTHTEVEEKIRKWNNEREMSGVEEMHQGVRIKGN